MGLLLALDEAEVLGLPGGEDVGELCLELPGLPLPFLGFGHLFAQCPFFLAVITSDIFNALPSLSLSFRFGRGLLA